MKSGIKNGLFLSIFDSGSKPAFGFVFRQFFAVFMAGFVLSNLNLTVPGSANAQTPKTKFRKPLYGISTKELNRSQLWLETFGGNSIPVKNGQPLACSLLFVDNRGMPKKASGLIVEVSKRISLTQQPKEQKFRCYNLESLPKYPVVPVEKFNSNGVIGLQKVFQTKIFESQDGVTSD